MKDKTIKDPLLNGYCERCQNHYLQDGDEERCLALYFGMGHLMCAQVRECYIFNEKGGAEK